MGLEVQASREVALDESASRAMSGTIRVPAHNKNWKSAKPRAKSEMLRFSSNESSSSLRNHVPELLCQICALQV